MVGLCFMVLKTKPRALCGQGTTVQLSHIAICISRERSISNLEPSYLFLSAETIISIRAEKVYHWKKILLKTVLNKHALKVKDNTEQGCRVSGFYTNGFLSLRTVLNRHMAISDWESWLKDKLEGNEKGPPHSLLSPQLHGLATDKQVNGCFCSLGVSKSTSEKGVSISEASPSPRNRALQSSGLLLWQPALSSSAIVPQYLGTRGFVLTCC